MSDYTIEVNDSGNPHYTSRILIGHPVTGLLRVEWVQARYGQLVPMNWSQVEMMEAMSGYYPMRYQVADAQNLIVQKAIEGNFEWVLLWEHDVLPPPDTLVKLNKYMRDSEHPVVSGLYYSRSRPSEPLVFRGRGTGVYTDWQHGDMVWCDGVPTGMLLISVRLLREMWNEAPEYMVKNRIARRVFETPRDSWHDPETTDYHTMQGTSDLHWCTSVMTNGYFAKSGWPEFQEKENPFLIDTTIFCKHINPDGEQFP